MHQTHAEDPGADSDEAETKYQEMVDDQEVAYERAAVGVTMARLLQMSDEQGQGQGQRAGDATAVPAATATSAKKDKKKHRGGIGSSDEEAPKRTAGKAKKLVGSGNSKPVRSSSGAAAAGSGSGRPVPPKAGTAKGDNPVAADGTPSKGRKAKPISEVVSEQIDSFNMGDENSIHFGEHSHVSLRSLKRYIAIAIQKVASAAPDDVGSAQKE
eukprot:15576610-Heterocapsa_arctica.AAC.1